MYIQYECTALSNITVYLTRNTGLYTWAEGPFIVYIYIYLFQLKYWVIEHCYHLLGFHLHVQLSYYIEHEHVDLTYSTVSIAFVMAGR